MVVEAARHVLSQDHDWAGNESDRLFGFGASIKDYIAACPDWNKGTHASIQGVSLLLIRLGLLTVNTMMFATCVATNEAMWFLYWYTFWGYLVSMFAVLASLKAQVYVDSDFWKVAATFTTQWGMSLSLIITPLFWFIMAPHMFPKYSWHGMDLFLRIHMTTLHSVPILSMAANTMLTDFKPMAGEWKSMLALGIFYIPFNYAAYVHFGKGVYPILDWTNVPLTIVGWSVVAAIQAYLYFKWTGLLYKYRKWIGCDP